ncbi:MAG: M48 family metallopeptidase [Candidatus Aminicenantia bacterium]
MKLSGKHNLKIIPSLIVYFLYLWLMRCAPVRGPWEIEESKVGHGFNLMSKETEIEYSQQIVKDIEQEVEILDDPVSNRYITYLGERIVRNTHLKHLVKDYDWSFKIINSSVVNAFATLGGKIYINRGLIEKAESEAELAGVVGHEIGHVMGRHISQQISKIALMNLLVQAGTLIIGGEGKKILSDIFKTAGGIGTFFASLKYSRDAEREADYLAVQNVHDAGIDPRGMVTFFYRLLEIEKEKGASIWWLSTHPPTQERTEWVTFHIENLPRSKYKSDEINFKKVKLHLQSLPPPVEPKKSEVSSPELVKTVAVHGNSGWVDTEIDIESNQEIFIQASGEICLQKGNPKAWCDPDGLPYRSMQQPFPQQNIGALIGKIGRDGLDYFLVGTRNTIKILEGGRLFLGINENLIKDNSGSFIVKIYLRPS